MCGESRMHGVKRGKTRRLYQRVTYRYSMQRKPMKLCMIQKVRCFMMTQEKSTPKSCSISTMGKNYYRRQGMRTRYQLQEIQAGREYFGRDRKTEYRC